MSQGMSIIYNRPALYRTALKFAPIINHFPRAITYCSLNAWGQGRELPVFARESFEERFRKGKLTEK